MLKISFLNNIPVQLHTAFKQTKVFYSLLSSRYKKLEEIRLEKEHQFQMEQTKLENNRRKEKREHELKIFSMMMGNIHQ